MRKFAVRAAFFLARRLNTLRENLIVWALAQPEATEVVGKRINARNARRRWTRRP